MALSSIPIPKKVKTEIKIVDSLAFRYDSRRSYEEIINDYLKDGWEILNSASGAIVFFDHNLVIERYTYTTTLIKTFYE